MRLWQIPGMLRMSLAWMLTGCAAAPSVPGPLQVPPTQVLIKQLHATGVQIYQCQPIQSDPARFEWAFKQPEATLLTKGGRSFGKHYAGPTWEAHDGSKLVGEMIGRSDSSKPGSIPWLLLRAKTVSGDGVFAGVQFVQRLNTSGGNAPATACRQEQVGQELRVSYTADYLFYGEKR